MLKSQADSGELKHNGGSSLGGRSKQRLDDEYRYDRDEMLQIAKSELSMQRPSYLSTEFDNEDGKFQPDKWLEYRWVCEGVENRPNANARRKEKIKPEALDGNSTVLSPQRRGFSSGCRAASPHKTEAEPERLGTNKGNWRSGAGFMLKNTTATTDFKPSFQKSSVAAGDTVFTRSRQTNNADRRAAGDGTFKPSFHKDTQSQNRNRMVSGLSTEEKVPEWMEEGPTSMHDMIELKGFDDERKNVKRGSGNKTKKEGAPGKQQQKANATKASVANRLEASMVQSTGEKAKKSVPSIDSKSSRGSESTSPSVDKNESVEAAKSPELVTALPAPRASSSATEKSQEPSVISSPLPNNKLPNSDAEFAAIMGLLDTSDFDSLKENALSSSKVASEPAPCSRLSRFFSTTKSEPQVNAQSAVPGDSNNNESAAAAAAAPATTSNSILRKIFASSKSSSPMPMEQAGSTALPGVVRAEDLEKGFQWEATRGAIAPPSTSNASDHLRQLGISPQPNSAARHHQLASYQVSKGNPLGDPQQQAQLMNKLNKFAQQQDMTNIVDVRAGIGRSSSPLMQQQHLRSSAGQMAATSSELPRFRTPVQDAALQAVIARSQLDAVFLKNLQYAAANQRAAAMMQQSAHPQSSDPAAVSAMLAGLMVSANAPHGGMPGPNVSVAGNAAQPRAPAAAVPNAFMPTSVMRQMTKNNVSVDDKQRRATTSNPSVSHAEEDKQRNAGESAALKQAAEYARGHASSINGNSPDVLSKLLQQQYMQQFAAAIRQGVPAGSYPVPPHLLPQLRAQAFAVAQAEQQRLYALALMRNDVNQAQAIRARMAAQQAAAVQAGILNVNAPTTSSAHFQHNPQAAVSGQQPQYMNVAPAVQAPDVSAQNVHKYQSPLEKLLQSAGVPTKQPGRAPSQDKPQGGAGMPSIISRLPPQANCISLEELEKQYASN